MAGPDSYPSTGSFFTQHPSSIRPPFESRSVLTEPMRETCAQLRVCVLDKTLWLIHASEEPHRHMIIEERHTQIVIDTHWSAPAHTSQRLMELRFTIYTYLWCAMCVIVCKIYFKVAMSISLADDAFFISHQGCRDVCHSHTHIHLQYLYEDFHWYFTFPSFLTLP